MSHAYPYDTLWVNGRFASLANIISKRERALTQFEEHTFTFIKDWFSGKNDVEITSSGSTGTPKQITITRDQMVASAMMTAQVLALQTSQTCLVCIDTNFIGGRMMLCKGKTQLLRGKNGLPAFISCYKKYAGCFMP